MEVLIERRPEEPVQVVIRCREENAQILRLKAYIEAFSPRLQGKLKDKTVFVEYGDILYFDSVDNRTYLYTADAVLEIRYRLYELEEMLPAEDFFRVSKSQLLNVNQIRTLAPGLNRAMLATMRNGEQVYISRKYAAQLRKVLSI